jgi:hypothetical protein
LHHVIKCVAVALHRHHRAEFVRRQGLASPIRTGDDGIRRVLADAVPLHRRVVVRVVLLRISSFRSVGFGRAAITAGYTVLFTSATTLIAQLVKAHTQGHLDEKLLFFTKPKLLIIDELGYLPIEPDAAHVLFQLVSRRYERGSILLTSNRAVSEWGAVFGDPVVATAILDRLLHHSHVITIRGDSYRLKEKRRAGLLTASKQATMSSTSVPQGVSS